MSFENKNLFLTEDSKLTGWRTQPTEGQTATANIGKETVQPTEPETTKYIEPTLAGLSENQTNLRFLPKLPGSRVISATAWIYAKVDASSEVEVTLGLKNAKLGAGTGWYSLKLTLTEAEELTSTSNLTIKAAKGTTPSKVYAAYVQVKVIPPTDPLLLGSSTKQAVAVTFAANKAAAIQYEAVGTGTLENIIVETASTLSTVKNLKLAVVTDNLGKPGTLLEEHNLEGNFEAQQAYIIEGFNQKIVQGQLFWIVYITKEGTFKSKWLKEKGTPTMLSSTPSTITKYSDVTAWAANGEHGPMFTEGMGTKFTLTGSLSFAAVPRRNTTTQQNAVLNFVGAMTPLAGRYIKKLEATLNFAGMISTKTVKQLSATLSFLADLRGGGIKKLEAVLSFAGALGKNTRHGLPATLSFVGAIKSTRTILHQLPATLSFSGLLRRTIRLPLAAELSFSGTLRRTIMQFRPVLSFVGNLITRTIGKYVPKRPSSTKVINFTTNATIQPRSTVASIE